MRVLVWRGYILLDILECIQSSSLTNRPYLYVCAYYTFITTTSIGYDYARGMCMRKRGTPMRMHTK